MSYAFIETRMSPVDLYLDKNMLSAYSDNLKRKREKKRWRNVLSSYADCWPLPQLIMKMLPCGNLATILSCPIRPRKWLVSHPRSALGDSASFEDSIGSLQSGHNLPKLLKLFEILSIILNSKPIHSARYSGDQDIISVGA